MAWYLSKQGTTKEDICYPKLSRLMHLILKLDIFTSISAVPNSLKDIIVDINKKLLSYISPL
jgi:hypothetical protein